jgi:hypothetical protein
MPGAHRGSVRAGAQPAAPDKKRPAGESPRAVSGVEYLPYATCRCSAAVAGGEEPADELLMPGA